MITFFSMVRKYFITVAGMTAFAMPLQAQGDAAVAVPGIDPEIDSRPKIALIIDDIGDRALEGRAAVNLPGPVACAFLPHTPYAAELARLAHTNNKTVMLHLPLQATNGKALGPGGILLDTTENEFRRTLEENLKAIPHVEGVNNHMGSLLTRHPGHMGWLMQVLREHDDLFFIDSYTHKDSVALQLAGEHQLRAIRRDVFLDHDRDPDAIRAEFERLVTVARENGHAVGIGHPYVETMEFLAETLPELEEKYGVKLVAVTELLPRRAPMAAGQVPASKPAAPQAATSSQNSN